MVYVGYVQCIAYNVCFSIFIIMYLFFHFISFIGNMNLLLWSHFHSCCMLKFTNACLLLVLDKICDSDCWYYTVLLFNLLQYRKIILFKWTTKMLCKLILQNYTIFVIYSCNEHRFLFSLSREPMFVSKTVEHLLLWCEICRCFWIYFVIQQNKEKTNVNSTIK